MYLIVYCKQCKKKISFWTFARDRVELKMKFGNTIELTCKKCKSKNNYEIRKFKAQHKFTSLVIFLITLLLIGLVIYYLKDYAKNQVSSYLLIPVGLFIILLVYTAINKELEKNTQNFNRS